MDKSIPLHQIYSQREDFVIVALTGITGSGCSNFADMMCMDFEHWHKHNLIRLYDDVSKIPAEGKHGEVFKREYQRCYLVSRQYEPFTVIKYKDVLILYMLKELFGKYQKVETVIERLTAILAYKFHHSHGKEINDYEVNSNFQAETIIGWGWPARNAWLLITKKTLNSVFFVLERAAGMTASPYSATRMACRPTGLSLRDKS